MVDASFVRMAKLREAGASPALPRNCKRGHGTQPLGKPGKAVAEVGSNPYSQARRPALTIHRNPFRV